MTYSAPELLLVGAAQNLVLSLSGDRFNIEDLPGQSDYEELW